MQYFFVDESGDPGLRNPKNSPYYIVAMAQLPNREPIAELAALRRELRLAPNFEFHFYQMNSEQKERFFRAIQPLSFRIRTAALIKSDVPLELRNLNSTELAMELLTNLTLRSSPLDIANDILVLDSVPETFLKSLRVHFTRAYKLERRERPFKKFVSSDSRHDDGLQLADMAAGAIRQYIWEDDSAYYQMFSRKVVDLWRVG
jgi:hypothetical protein